MPAPPEGRRDRGHATLRNPQGPPTPTTPAMHPATRPNADQRRNSWGGALFVGGLLAFALALWGGCSPQQRYRTLSFFFDGVPDPDAPLRTAEGDGGRTGADGKPVRVVLHKPYADNQCNACHQTATGRFEEFTKLEAAVCLKCHQQAPRQYAYMHGPVANAQCNLCHVPHESTTASLLRDNSPAVCVQCHDQSLLGSQPPAHLEAKRDCLECHSGHGSMARYLLRSDRAATATAPATAAAAAAGGGPP